MTLSAEQKTALINAYLRTGELQGFSDEMLNDIYAKECRRLNLDPFDRPFDVISFKKGSLRLYLTSKGNDTLAAIHNISRVTIHQPQVRVVQKALLVYCQSEAILPAGRRQSASAFLPYNEVTLATDLMKIETKAERRATMKLMGIGALLEDDLSSIPNVMLPAVEPKQLDPGTLSTFVTMCLTSSDIRRDFPDIARDFTAATSMPQKVLSDAVTEAMKVRR